MASENFLDELWRGLGNAITDIRQRVVEEPMYGKIVTEQQPQALRDWPESKEQSWQEREVLEQKKEQERGLDR